ncbi:hypothetical protein LTR09_001968 [Extremus antarcticus]|uniref:NAD(P)-binding protein n=1 Tax=Extremus antarcticus TaxID=702011 RepID=A0AAJ0GG76_9PEZI|nr:hypothetical protein LTR09_001968 [Extremus antarcticus]
MSHHRAGPVAPGIAFITGGARGLGNAIACSFAKEGSKGVALIDIQDEKTFNEGKESVEKYGAKCITIHCDVTKEDQVERAVKEAVDTFGRIDYAANFAGIIGPLQPTWDVDMDQWRKVMEINSVGVMICNKHELKQMIKQNSVEVEEGRPPQQGSIVNCASVNSIMCGPGTTGYSAAKHSVMGITKAAALEARVHNIRVNAVSPGFLQTKLFDTVTNTDIDRDILGSDAWTEYEKRQGRAAHPDEIGDVVVLLSTPRMSLVNGHNLVVDNGFTINETAS